MSEQTLREALKELSDAVDEFSASLLLSKGLMITARLADAANKAAAALSASIVQSEPRLTKPARIGATVFHAGVKESLVIDRAQREYEYAAAPVAQPVAMIPVEILDRFPEINPSNYSHDDVCNLNSWGVEVVLAATEQKDKP